MQDVESPQDCCLEAEAYRCLPLRQPCLLRPVLQNARSQTVFLAFFQLPVEWLL